MSDYTQKTDDELLAYIKKNDSLAMNELIVRYRSTVEAIAMKYIGSPLEKDDLVQEGMIGLFKAIRDYDCGRDASFFTFADLCISRQMYTAVQASRREKHVPLNTYVSLYSVSATEKEEGEEGQLINALASNSGINPEELLIDKENVENLERIIEKELSGFEKEVLDLYVVGMSYSQIARILGRDEKSTDNALQRIKTKLKRFIK